MGKKGSCSIEDHKEIPHPMDFPLLVSSSEMKIENTFFLGRHIIGLVFYASFLYASLDDVYEQMIFHRCHICDLLCQNERL